MKATKEILEFPWMTEKSTAIRMTSNSYVFKVKPSANKIEIKKAVEALFSVKVADVHTQIVRGKLKRVGRFTGMRPSWKKAIVTLQAGNKIEFFEGV